MLWVRKECAENRSKPGSGRKCPESYEGPVLRATTKAGNAGAYHKRSLLTWKKDPLQELCFYLTLPLMEASSTFMEASSTISP